jgi:beta-galactosidase
MEEVYRYYDQLMPVLRPMQSAYGGPIVAFYLENEYGAFSTTPSAIPAHARG